MFAKPGLLVAHFGRLGWYEPQPNNCNAALFGEIANLACAFTSMCTMCWPLQPLLTQHSLSARPMPPLKPTIQGQHASIKGPGGVDTIGWATINDLWRLNEDFAQQVSFRPFTWRTKAPQVKVNTTDTACTDHNFFTQLVTTKQLPRMATMPSLVPQQSSAFTLDDT